MFVPWTLPTTNPALADIAKVQDPPTVFQRYYHMFDKGELRDLVCAAAAEIGIIERSEVQERSSAKSSEKMCSLEFVQDGWERSNFFVELRLREE